MWTWTSLVVLALAVASTLSFPRSDAEYNIPSVGLGARAQYYVLHSDGTYKYGYDTGDGIYEQSMAQAPGNVNGAFGYKDATGEDIKLEYTADDRGFIARGTHLPVAPEADFGTPITGTYAASSGGISPAYSARPAASSGSGVASVRSSQAVPFEVAQVRSSAADDGSYSFSYDTSSSSRSESADARNSVKGKYSFVADDGVNRQINYIAGSETGYIAEGDSLPVGPSVPGAESGIPTGRILPVLSEEEANALAASTSTGSAGAPPVVAYSAPSSPASSSSQVTSQKVSSGASASDASYSFSYDAGDSSRSESADPSLNVQGTYSFVPADSNQRLTVNYRAGSDTGFVAEGAHFPVAPVADFGTSVTGIPAASSGGISPAYSARPSTSVAAASGSGVASVRSSPAAPIEVAQVRSSAADDGSYSFSYDTSSSSRSESADARNSVKGKYSFVADDGVNRQINYIAGSETGYIAEGDSLPVGPSVPGAESGIPTGRILPVLSEEEANALAASTSTGSAGAPPVVAYSAPSSPASSSSQVTSQKVSSGASASDASYSFSYDAGDSSRSESADPSLNVQGTYSFVPADSNQRLTVNYRAGSDTGFVAEGAHFPVAPVADFGTSVTGIPAASSGGISPAYSARPSTSVAAASGSGVASVRSSPAAPIEVAQVRSSAADDGSYSFSYDTSSSSRSESADARNSVKGKYSFVADDGVNRQINYIAGSETGYIAEGDSLPVGPSVPGAESGIPTGRILPVLSEEEANALAASTSTGSAGAPPVVAYSAPSSPASSSSQVTSQKISSGASASDASYSFSYDAGDSSRSESADPSLNVQGTYSFVPADSNQRLTVNYRAGSDTGFVAEGAHFPVAPVADFGASVTGIPAASSRGISPAYSARPSTSVAAASGSGVASVRSSQAAYASSGSKTERVDSAGTRTAAKIVPKDVTPIAATKSAGGAPSGQASGSPSGHTSHVVGNVLLHQYAATNANKYGYVFTAIRR